MSERTPKMATSRPGYRSPLGKAADKFTGNRLARPNKDETADYCILDFRLDSIKAAVAFGTFARKSSNSVFLVVVVVFFFCLLVSFFLKRSPV